MDPLHLSLIMCYSNQSEMTISNIRGIKSNWLFFISSIVPGIHPRCIVGEKLGHEFLMVCNNIIALMTINVHPVLLARITPSKLLQPLSFALLRNFLPLNASCLQPFLNFWTGNYFNHIQCFDEIVLCLHGQLQLDLHGDIFILKDIKVTASVTMQGELPMVDKSMDPLPNGSCMINTMAL